MNKAATELAKQLLGSPEADFDVLRVHQFSDDESAHDDAQTERLYSEFVAELEGVVAELTSQFGEPLPDEQSDRALIPIGGVIAFCLWVLGDRHLFAAVAHEDRGCPILIAVGAT